MYTFAIRPELDKKLKKLIKKNRQQYEIIMQKIEEIIDDPHRFKNLRRPLQHLKRVHIDSHFVLTFSIEEDSRTVIFEDFEHHDKVYRMQ